MKKIIFIINISLFVCFYILLNGCFDSQFNKEIPGLKRVFKSDRDDISFIRFHPDNVRMFFIQKGTDPNTDKLIEYNLIKDIYKTIFSVDEYYDLSNTDHASIRDFYLIDSETLILWSDICIDCRPDKVPNLKSVVHEIKINNNYQVKDIDLTEDILYSQQSVINRNLFVRRTGNHKKFVLYDIKRKKEFIYDFPEFHNKIANSPAAVCLGRNIDEVFFSYTTEDKEEILICEYNYRNKKIINKFKVSDRIKKNLFGNNFTDILLSPDLKYLILNHPYYGIWILDLVNNEFIDVINTSTYSIYFISVYDFSWDLNEVVLRDRLSIYILDIDQFLFPKRKNNTDKN